MIALLNWKIGEASPAIERGQPLDLRIEADADERVVAIPDAGETLREARSCHAAPVRRGCAS